MIKKHPWSCMTAAAAMVLDIDEVDLFFAIGHDGSCVQWPENAPLVTMYRGFCQQEIITAVLDTFHIPVVSLLVNPGHASNLTSTPCVLYENPQTEIEKRIKKSSGILLGEYNVGAHHAIANLGGVQHNPNTGKEAEAGFTVDQYLMFYGV